MKALPLPSPAPAVTPEPRPITVTILPREGGVTPKSRAEFIRNLRAIAQREASHAAD